MPTAFRPRKARIRPLLTFYLAGGLSLATSLSASAQIQGQIETILNVVTTRRGTAPFRQAVRMQPLATGDNLRTGEQSKASVRFNDKSLLKINSLSNIVIQTGLNQRDVNISSGRVYGDYKGPGRFRGRYATAAVRGTKLEVEETPTRTVVRCFEGSVVVVPSNIKVVTGQVTVGQVPGFQSNSLVNETQDLVGGRVYITGGTQNGQQRTITTFDPVTGTITLDAPFPGATDATSRFVIVNPPNTPVVTLRPGYETYVSNTLGTPAEPYPTAPLSFIGGDELAWTEDGFSGNQQTHLSGFIHDEVRSRYFEIDDARDTSQIYHGLAPGVQRPPTENPSPAPGTGGVGVGVGSGNGGVGVGVGTGTGGVGVGVGGNTGGIGIGVGTGTGGIGIGVGGGTGGIGIGVGGNTGGTGIGIGNPGGTGGVDVTIGRSASRAFVTKIPQAGGAVYTTQASDSSLAYARASGVINNVFVRVSGRVGSLSRVTGNALDEAMLRYRSPKAGDFQVGRFHWFPGPVSNGELGKLISFTTVDGVLWRLPTGDTHQIQLGYFPRINPLRGPSVGGYTARYSLAAGIGRVGGSLLGATQRGSDLGFSGDVAYPVIPQNLELYGEVGRDTLRHGFYAIGAYFPSLLRAIHANTYLEYSYRGPYGGSLDFNIHVPVTRNFGALFTVSKPGASGFRPGIGVTAIF